MATRLGFDLILLGAPAAGKDTQAEILQKKFQFKTVETGKHWRRLAKQKNATGALLRRTFSKGNPTPVKLMKQFLTKQLSKAPKNNNLLFIGNPRLKPEAQLLDKLLKTKNRDYLVISITLPESQIRLRSLKRMRDDQDWKYVDNRIKMYKLQVSKTLDYFMKLGKLKTVDGNRGIMQVARDIQKAVNDYQRRSTTRNLKTKRPNPR
jgi:adenylate kinase family enzyme